MTWNAQWIWCGGETAPRNLFVRFRRTFNLTDVPAKATLRISADSRYRLFVNGEWLGDGPPRSWPWEQTYDTYDLAALLQPGKNCVAVLVTHYGESTFQYILGRGGLLCELDLDGRVVGTDRNWKASPQSAYLRPTTRISCQMAFEEQFDARLDDPGWEQPAFADAHWSKALLVGKVGCEPWTSLIPRDIPQLTRDACYPVRLLEARAVVADAVILTLDTRSTLLKGDLTANPHRARGVYVTEIHSPADQQVELAPSAGERTTALYLNGKRVDTAQPNKTLKLKKGSNILSVLYWDHNHHWMVFSLALRPKKPLRIQTPGDKQAKGQWLFIEPRGHGSDEARLLRRAATCASARELEAFSDRARPVPFQDHIPVNAYGISRAQTPLEDASVSVDMPEALCTDSADWTTVQAKRGDAELLIDFGRILLGFREFEIDAPEGTIVDWMCFEAIEDGRIHHTDGNQNAMRYVCREGRQTFTGFVKHGFRYAFVTIRDAKRPVRIRLLRVLLQTYNVEQSGAFLCSDPLLNQIWDVGRYTLRLCSEDTFTDCPSYEQTYWVGDGRNEALISYATWGPTALASRCVQLPAGSLKRSPLPESQVPSGWQAILPAWFMMWIMMVEEYHRYSDDQARLKAVYPAVRQTLQTCRERYCTFKGLFTIEAWNLFDWAPQDIGSATVTHNNMFLAEACLRAALLAKALGKPDDAQWFGMFREELVQAINEHLWSEEKQAYVDCIRDSGQSQAVSQHCNSLALLYDIAPPARAERIAHWAATPPEGAVKVGSPFAMFYIFEALARQGRHDAILAEVRKQWGGMLDKGATTFWETFPGFDQAWFTRSHCHAWSSAPTYFLTTYQLGIAPAAPGFARVRIAPQPVDLTFARGEQPTPRGPVRVEWERTPDRFQLTATLPPGVPARIELPVDAKVFTAVEINGKTPPTSGRVNGVGRLVQEDVGWTLETSPGVQVAISATRA